jgi:hypothetical protein
MSLFKGGAIKPYESTDFITMASDAPDLLAALQHATLMAKDDNLPVRVREAAYDACCSFLAVQQMRFSLVSYSESKEAV